MVDDQPTDISESKGVPYFITSLKKNAVFFSMEVRFGVFLHNRI